jgi:hypothetical protein
MRHVQRQSRAHGDRKSAARGKLFSPEPLYSAKFALLDTEKILDNIEIKSNLSTRVRLQSQVLTHSYIQYTALS